MGKVLISKKANYNIYFTRIEDRRFLFTAEYPDGNIRHFKIPDFLFYLEKLSKEYYDTHSKASVLFNCGCLSVYKEDNHLILNFFDKFDRDYIIFCFDNIKEDIKTISDIINKEIDKNFSLYLKTKNYLFTNNPFTLNIDLHKKVNISFNKLGKEEYLLNAKIRYETDKTILINDELIDIKNIYSLTNV